MNGNLETNGIDFRRKKMEDIKDNLKKLKKLDGEKHYVIVLGWKTVQMYLGTQIGQDEVKRMGIKKGPTRKGRGNKTMYWIPYPLLVKRLIQNQRKIIALQKSIDIIRLRLMKDPIMKDYLEKTLIEHK